MDTRTPGESRLLEQYLEKAYAHKFLSSEDAAALAPLVRAGDTEAKNKMIFGNLRLVLVIARMYEGCGLPLSELVGVGNVGLVTAVDTFDETKHAEFPLYAIEWIRKVIQRAVNAQRSLSVRSCVGVGQRPVPATNHPLFQKAI